MEQYTEEINKLYQQAVYEMEQWDLDKAQEHLGQVIEQDPQHAGAHNKLGVIYARREDYTQAEHYFEAAIQLDPQLASAYSNLGNVYQVREWTDRAISAYEKAIKIDQEHPTAHHNLGVLYKKIGRVGEGVEFIKKGAKMDKSKMKDDLRRSPSRKRTHNILWLVVAGLVAWLLFFNIR